MNIPAGTARRLAAARDIAAVLAFITLVFLGGRAVVDSPYLQRERLTKAEAASDISQFFSEAEKSRSAPAAADLAALKAGALAQAGDKLDGFGRITVRDLAYILYRSAASFGDPATSLLWRPPHKWKDPEPRFPPFALDYRRGKFVVAASGDPALAGTELVTLNGVPFTDYIKPVLERVSADGPRGRAAAFCADQAFWWDFSGLLAGQARFTVGVKGPGGKSLKTGAAPVSAWEFRRLAGVPAAPKDRFNALRGVAWVDVPDMDYSRAWKRGYADIFRKIRRQKETYLVLDLRRNSGWDPRAAYYLLSFLYADEVGGPEPFSGHTTVLIGPGTANAGALFAALFRDQRLGELAGEETGGPPNGYWIPEARKLDESAIPFSVPARRFTGYAGPQGAVAPDLALTAELLAPAGGDIKAFMLSRIAREKAAGRPPKDR